MKCNKPSCPFVGWAGLCFYVVCFLCCTFLSCGVSHDQVRLRGKYANIKQGAALFSQLLRGRVRFAKQLTVLLHQAIAAKPLAAHSALGMRHGVRMIVADVDVIIHDVITS